MSSRVFNALVPGSDLHFIVAVDMSIEKEARNLKNFEKSNQFENNQGRKKIIKKRVWQYQKIINSLLKEMCCHTYCISVHSTYVPATQGENLKVKVRVFTVNIYYLISFESVVPLWVSCKHEEFLK